MTLEKRRVRIEEGEGLSCLSGSEKRGEKDIADEAHRVEVYFKK
jgi:hypothetical protein